MLLPTQQFELYSEWSEAIEAADARAAFYYLIGIAASSRRYVCHAQWKGEVRDFRFIDASSNQQPYSFITNQRWLLFYFRAPAVRSGVQTRDAIAARFDSFNENTAGEWTVKLASLADVDRLSQVIAWQ